MCLLSPQTLFVQEREIDILFPFHLRPLVVIGKSICSVLTLEVGYVEVKG